MEEEIENAKIQNKIESLEQKMREKDQKIQQLENKINKLTQGKQEQTSNTEKKEISRRDFLKKLGIGAVGLGMLSIPASAKFQKVTTQNWVNNKIGNETIQVPAYQENNLPTGKPEGTIAYDKTNNQLVVEDGT